MSNQWHYSQEGAQYGPVDESEIVRLIQDGELAPGTPVCKEGGMAWDPARNHACFQVEIYPKKKQSPKDKKKRPDLSIDPDFEVELLKVAESTVNTAASTSGGGTSQPARKATARPTASSNPAVVPATEENLSGLSWVVIGVASLVLVGVIVFMDSGSDTPQLAQTYYERGGNFDFGRGGESKDYAEAAKWYRKAADMGHADAQAQIGWIYQAGLGVGKDYAEALKWHRRAVAQGSAVAQNNLGVMYDNGDGVLEDDKEAVKWFRKAAEQGNAGAQANLGVMYNNGEGVPRDYVTAYAWYNIAAANGNTEAAKNKADTASRLTPAQIIQAQALSRTLSSQIRTP